MFIYFSTGCSYTSNQGMKYMCKVSVIMPAYNCSEFIGEAIASVLNQSEADLELIVINDGSTDGTLDIVKTKAEMDSRVKVVSQANSGKPSIARNRGLKLAKGQYIAFLDGDDVYETGKLEKMLSVFESQPGIDMVFHDVCLMDSTGVRKTSSYLETAGFAESVLTKSQQINHETFLCDPKELFFFMCTKVTTIHTSTPLIRKKRLDCEDVFFPEDLTIAEDLDLFFRLVKTGGIAYINKSLSLYRVYPQSVTHRPDRNVFDPVSSLIRNYRRTPDFLSSYQRNTYRQRIAYDLYNVAYNCNKQGRHKDSILFSLRSLRWSFKMAPVKEVVKALIAVVWRKVGSDSYLKDV